MARKSKTKKLQINLTNRWLYTLIVFFSLIVVGVFVYAAAGTTPNPGHPFTELQPCDVVGEILKSDGTTWACGTDEVGTGGGSLWNQSGSDIYYDTGKVGIGTINPQYGAKLEVADRMNIMVKDDVALKRSRLFLGLSGNNYLEVFNDGVNSRAGITTYSSAYPLILQQLGGNVGIGTTSPNALLHVSGGIILGTSDETCSPDFAGMLRFRQDVCEGPICSSYLEICMGADGSLYDWYTIESITEPF